MHQSCLLRFSLDDAGPDQAAASDGAEACVCDLTPDTGLAQSTVSHHLKLLVDSGLLERTQRGKWAYYSLTPAAKKLLK
jgi:ArsR family transcriptional regulator